jgi:hypothetical protein
VITSVARPMSSEYDGGARPIQDIGGVRTAKPRLESTWQEIFFTNFGKFLRLCTCLIIIRAAKP